MIGRKLLILCQFVIGVSIPTGTAFATALAHEPSLAAKCFIVPFFTSLALIASVTAVFALESLKQTICGYD